MIADSKHGIPPLEVDSVLVEENNNNADIKKSGSISAKLPPVEHLYPVSGCCCFIISLYCGGDIKCCGCRPPGFTPKYDTEDISISIPIILYA